MSIRQLADDSAREILVSLGGNIDKTNDVAQIIEKALIMVVRDTRAGCVDVVNICCSADQDLAHKISAGLRQNEKALIANLTSLR
jgi:hypothetical protein